MKKLLCLFAFSICFASSTAHAFEYDLRLDAGVVFSHFEQQVKTEIGGETGQKLVQDTEFGWQMAATWNVWSFLDIGIWAQFDAGKRTAARFAGFDSDMRTLVTDEVGGSFTEFWIGPLIRAGWKALFIEVGYGLVGIRTDFARDDLETENGNTEDALQTSATVAWVAGIGGKFEVFEDINVVLKLSYRVRYYDSRAGEALANEIVHGTQNFTPFMGIAWTPTLLGGN